MGVVFSPWVFNNIPARTRKMQQQRSKEANNRCNPKELPRMHIPYISTHVLSPCNKCNYRLQTTHYTTLSHSIIVPFPLRQQPFLLQLPGLLSLLKFFVLASFLLVCQNRVDRVLQNFQMTRVVFRALHGFTFQKQ